MEKTRRKNSMETPRIDNLIRSERKSVGLSVTREGLLVVRAPKRLPVAAIEDAVRERAGWIRKKQEENRARMGNFPPHAYEEGERFLFLGEGLTLHYSANVKKIFSSGGVLFVPMEKRESVRKTARGSARGAVEAWYKAEARAYFASRLGHFGALMGVRHTSLRLSSAVTRWGSCASGGGISLAWRLISAPPELVDYVIAHELAHLKRRDHSVAFWAEVFGVLPDYKKRRKELGEFSPVLTNL
ncbi:MAG: M48 family metallopeptidase [Eubacteriales bacterium]|nr:M48 family metallopeptidase [Eubacteriales bacterium]